MTQPKVVGRIVGDTLIIDFDENNPQHVAAIADMVDAPGCLEHDIPFCLTCTKVGEDQ